MFISKARRIEAQGSTNVAIDRTSGATKEQGSEIHKEV